MREVDDEFRSKHRLYKALESLDLLLSSFTKEIANDVDLIKEIKKYLDDTKVYTKWFTEYTGNLLTAVFESMPSDINVAGKIGTFVDAAGADAARREDNVTFNSINKLVNLKPPNNNTNASIATVDERSVRFLSYNVGLYGSGVLSGKPVTDDTKKTQPPNVGSLQRLAYDNGSVWGYPQYSSLSETLRNPTSTSHYYDSLVSNIRSGNSYGKALGVVCMKNKVQTRKNIDEFYNNFQALKNIFHSFISLYNRIIEKKI